MVRMLGWLLDLQGRADLLGQFEEGLDGVVGLSLFDGDDLVGDDAGGFGDLSDGPIAAFGLHGVADFLLVHGVRP